MSVQEPGSEFKESYPVLFSFISDTLFNIKAGKIKKQAKMPFLYFFLPLSDLPISSVRSHGKAVLPSLSRCLSPCHSVLRIPLSPVLFFGDGSPHTAQAAFKLGFQPSCLLRLPGSSLLSWYSVLLRTKTFPRVTMPAQPESRLFL